MAFTDFTDEQALLREVIEFYERRLKESPDALTWLKAHAIDRPGIIDHFHLGLADRTLGLALPEKKLKAGREVRARLQRLGILRESGHEHFAGALVVPVFDAQGEVVQVYGRLIGATLRAGTKRDLYLPGPGRGVWNLAGIEGSEAILCAGLIDGLTVWSAGMSNVTATLDPEAVPEDVLETLQARGVRSVHVAYPDDPRGNAAAQEVIQALQALGMTATRVALPAGMSVNALGRKRGAAAVRDAIERAQAARPVVVHVPEQVVVPNERGTSAAGSAAVSPEAVPRPTAAASDHRTDAVQLAGPDAPGDITVEYEDRRYRVRGLERNTGLTTLRVNLLAAREVEGKPFVHLDTLDLYVASKRAAFVKQAATELGLPTETVKADVGRLLLHLEEVQAEALRKALQAKAPPIPVLTEAEQAPAMNLLRDEHLCERIVGDFERCGVVGEATNALVGYLAAVSRKLDRPLAVVVQSSSAAGKTALLDAVLAFVPPEDRLQFSALTGQALYYLGASDIRHKVLAIAEDEGAERAAYALKLLQSAQELRIASTAKDSTGRLVAEEYVVRGPVAIFLTTTQVQVDEELLNRCIALTVNEGREQTRAIHRLQRERETLDGLGAEAERKAILKLHQDAQRLLRPLLVVNPFAPRLTFNDDRTRTRRDHMKYLALIRAVALLHQHQREAKTAIVGGRGLEYIEATAADIALANKLADEVLGRSLDDLPLHTRQLLSLLHEMVAAACAARRIEQSAYRFTRRTVREALGWGETQAKVHLRRLLEMEYLVVHRSGRGHAYELVYDGRGHDGGRFLAGLIDPEKLVEDERAGSGRPSGGPGSVGGRGSGTGESASGDANMAAVEPTEGENAQPALATEAHDVREGD